MHNLQPSANLPPGCKFTHGVYIGHVNGVLRKCTRVQICIRVQICSIFGGGANTVRQISIRVHICTRVQIAHMNATCYHKCTSWSLILINYPSFQYNPVLIHMKRSYMHVYRPFIKLKIMASVATASSDMPEPLAEQLEFLVHGL